MNKKLFKVDQPGQYHFILDSEGQELEIVGRFHLAGRDVKRWDVEIVHAAPRTTSKTDIRGVVDGDGQAFVYGTIKVLPKAVGTEAFLEERILLVSSGARAEAVPNLEIETDDVHCSHAATVGTIDEEELFYLTSRGIGQESAKEMIMDGFLR